MDTTVKPECPYADEIEFHLALRPTLLLRFLMPIGCLLGFLGRGASQDGIELKLGAHFAFNGSSSIPYFDEGQTDVLDFRWFAPAIIFLDGNAKYDEIELTNLVVQRLPSESVDTKASIGIRYEHGYFLTKSREAKVRLTLGFGLRGYGAIEQLNGLNTRGFEIENRIYGLAISFIPKFRCQLSKSLTMELSPYLDLLNVVTRIENVFDPVLPEEERISQDFRAIAMKPFARLAISWKL